MPLARYFGFVGSLLLALLFLADWYFPKLIAPPASAGIDKTIIRLHTAHRWPEATVYDTSLPTILPPPPAVVAERLPPAVKARPPEQAFALALPVRADPSLLPRKQLKRRHAQTSVQARRVAGNETLGFHSAPPAGW